MIKVLIVDDSLTARRFLENIINEDKDLMVVGTAKDGAEAVELTILKHPDVVIMDIEMPKLNGYEATGKIMELHPVPVIINSSHLLPDQVENTFRAMQAGAVAALEKPKGIGHPDSERAVAKLIQTVKTMSEVKVVRRRARTKERKSAMNLVSSSGIALSTAKIEIVAIGVSTGGPPVLKIILSALKAGFPLPIVIVQHISPGFLQGLVEWLRKGTALPIAVPSNGDRIAGGHIYFAPDGCHMEISSTRRIVFNNAADKNGLRPSVSHLFRSVANVYGDKALGILLTGMGTDGARELKTMKAKGAITIAQDKESSVVHGMPGEAIRIGAADYVFTPEEIAAFLNSLVHADD